MVILDFALLCVNIARVINVQYFDIFVPLFYIHEIHLNIIYNLWVSYFKNIAQSNLFSPIMFNPQSVQEKG